MAAKLPKGWSSIPPISTTIQTSEDTEEDEGIRFVIFKTPINNTGWTTREVLICRPELTNSDSLIINIKPNPAAKPRYSCSDFTNKGIPYREMYVRGTGNAPPDFVVSEFFNLVDDFAEENPDGVVGVQGTKGVDRPGYLVARYLIEKFGWDPDTAIDKVNAARGKNISEEDGLLYDLRERSSLWETEAMQHALVVNISSEEIAAAYTATEALKIGLIQEVLNCLPADLEVGAADVIEEKCIWLGTRHLMIWFHHREESQRILATITEDRNSWTEEKFKIERLEDRSNIATRPRQYNQLIQNSITKTVSSNMR